MSFAKKVIIVFWVLLCLYLLFAAISVMVSQIEVVGSAQASGISSTRTVPFPTPTLNEHWINPIPWPTYSPPDGYPAPYPTLEPEGYPEAPSATDTGKNKRIFTAEPGPDRGLWAWIWDLGSSLFRTVAGSS